MKRKRMLVKIGLVTTLVAACGLWFHLQRQQDALNRQLLVALDRNDAKTALNLVNTGADPNTRYSPPHRVTFKLMLDHLLHRQQAPGDIYQTALMSACGIGWNFQLLRPDNAVARAESLPLIEAMIAHSANVNTRNDTRHTPLHVAAGAYRWRTAEVLLEHGAEVDAQDNWGITPLMFAAQEGDVKLVQVLLMHGANPNIQCAAGSTALSFARGADNANKIVADLKAHGVGHDLDSVWDVPLTLSHKLKRVDMVHLLKQSKSNQQ